MNKIENGQEPETVSSEQEGKQNDLVKEEGTAPQTPTPVLGYDFLAPSPEAILHCAMICHNVTRALNDAHNEYTVPWEKNKDTVTDGVRFILDNPDATAEDSHENWRKFKEATGWKLGQLKDAEKKTHPLMVPYEMLGPFQRSKDAIFGALVRTYFGL